ncbi:transglutaminase-like cysteine peptidase [Microvirga yunnanensis]|uniref:transglutaminase-like cysteine peptidase n=1 Tax=Microvirga yunnanensis TaxID=2953740 RepID=UPI0021C61E45|nr:transglutaminase-like cysteine peptidase [Microvirga sp. HBU65207]
MFNASIPCLTLLLGSIVLLSSAIADRGYRPPAGSRAAIELAAGRLTDSRSKIAKSQLASKEAAEQDLPSLPLGPSVPSFGEAEPIPAWSDFCGRYPTECAVNLSEPAVLKLSAATWGMIGTINERVNYELKPVTDAEHWGVMDHWDLPGDGYGDCEDYQLLKRRLLAELGVPRRAMRITVVLDEAGEGHAVLMTRTDRGDYILDNRRQAVLAWSDTGYKYLKQEGSQRPAWVALDEEQQAALMASQ